MKTVNTGRGRITYAAMACVAMCLLLLTACALQQPDSGTEGERVEVRSDASSQQELGEILAAVSESTASVETTWNDIPLSTSSENGGTGEAGAASAQSDGAKAADELFAKLGVVQDFHESFVHGDKPDKFQKYIVLHDTEGGGEPEDVISYWDSSEEGIAAHFVIGKDGRVVQCVPLNKIAHHAGFGDTGHNEEFGVEDESRDDKVGTSEIGDWASDYGMNSYSIGIEMVHVGGEGDYPKEQLEALDMLIAYLDAYYGRECAIIDHKAWRTGNSDTSEEFAEYLESYQKRRIHE